MIDALQLACMVCESGALIDKYRHIIFEAGTLRAFNGVAQFEAPSDLPEDENFAVNEMKLASALRSCEGDDLKIRTTKDFLVFKRGKLTVRVRKITADAVFSPRMERPPKSCAQKAGNLLDAVRAIAPFVSSDASRPWSVAVLLKDGYAWATNNLSIVRFPLDAKLDTRLPGAVIPLLCSLPSIDYFAVSDGRISVACGKKLVSFPSTQGEWPDVAKFFAGRKAKLPQLDAELLEAAKTVEKFADRFVTLSDSSIEGKSQTIESEYEVVVKKGKGTYSARLLSLVLAHAQRGDFSLYPNPVPFEADSGLQGVAVGVRPEVAAA